MTTPYRDPPQSRFFFIGSAFVDLDSVVTILYSHLGTGAGVIVYAGGHREEVSADFAREVCNALRKYRNA